MLNLDVTYNILNDIKRSSNIMKLVENSSKLQFEDILMGELYILKSINLETKESVLEEVKVEDLAEDKIIVYVEIIRVSTCCALSNDLLTVRLTLTHKLLSKEDCEKCGSEMYYEFYNVDRSDVHIML
jgi:hypothetical protein